MKAMQFRALVALVAMIAAFCGINAEAQTVVTGFNTQDLQSCGEYLINHPADTIVSQATNNEGNLVVTKVFFENGIVSPETLVVKNTVMKTLDRKVKNVIKAGNDVVVVAEVKSENGVVAQDTTVYERTTIKDMTYEQQLAFLSGELKAVNPEHKDYDGNFRHKVNLSLLGGGVFGQTISPTATIRLGYETCHWLWELEGGFSSSKYTESADAKGRYITFSGTFNAGWKFLQDPKYKSYVAVLGLAGYGYQRSDSNEALERSKNYGLVFGGMARGSLHLGANWSLVGEVGYKIIPEVQKGEDQNLSAGGFFANIGITKSF